MTANTHRVLDLFSCAGGAGKGYADVGFAVDGCDIADRPNYPFPYHRGDALEYLARLITTGEIERYTLGDGGGKATVTEMQTAMGITWTDVHEELTEAIPPAFARWIGHAFLTARQEVFA
ncbi:hypothetical protein ACF1FE_04580 [Streptomyces griseofuscus]|uniref:hypothetical protein n=1 Tax=Streptomyces griseofuscus TaxID=146922 RepID=UPI00370333B5